MVMRRVYISLLILGFSVDVFGQQIFKCVNSDGTVVFSHVSCVAPDGDTEAVTLKINKVGTLASPEQIYRDAEVSQAGSRELAVGAAEDLSSKRPARVVERCSQIGATTFCSDSEGNKTVTNRIGNTEFEKKTGADGTVQKKIKHNY